MLGNTGTVGRSAIRRPGSRRRRNARRWGAGVAVVGLLVTTFVGAWTGPASASLRDGFSIPEEFPLRADVIVPPPDPRHPDPKDQGTVVISQPITLQKGQTRRVSDQLVLASSESHMAEVDNIVECMDPSNNEQAAVATDSGTNHQGSGSGPVTMHASLLFTAPETGTYNCEIHANTSDDNNTGYHMTALADAFPAGTWLEIDNFTTDAPQWWQNPTCDSKGSSDTNCVFLGRPRNPYSFHPVTTTLYQADSLWTAGPDALAADLTAHMQITSCPVGTSSCPWAQWGGPNYLNPVSVLPTDYGEATFTTHLDFIQLDQFGTWCRVLSTPETKYTISNSVHHFLVDYTPPLVSISQTCGGSRRFMLRAIVTWISGNTVKIDSGSNLHYRSATNANVIVRSTRATTMVPKVIGTDEGDVAGHLAAFGLTVGTITRVMNPMRPGTVIAENSPAGTIEPLGSPVNLTISLGAVTVPALRSLSLADATRTLTATGLVASISYLAACIEPGHVISQGPDPGVLVAPGSTIRITVDNGTPRTCGSTK